MKRYVRSSEDNKIGYAYYINGWRESRNYFFDIGNFTDEELKQLYNGEQVEHGDNIFWLEERRD